MTTSKICQLAKNFLHVTLVKNPNGHKLLNYTSLAGILIKHSKTLWLETTYYCKPVNLRLDWAEFAGANWSLLCTCCEIVTGGAVTWGLTGLDTHDDSLIFPWLQYLYFRYNAFSFLKYWSFQIMMASIY